MGLQWYYLMQLAASRDYRVKHTNPQTEMTLVHGRILSSSIRDDFQNIGFREKVLVVQKDVFPRFSLVLPGTTSC
jgi:hypothetical protein